GTVLAIFLLITFAISIGAIVQPNHVTGGLVMLNYALLVDAITIVVIGSFVWFFTLQERNNFYKLWLAATSETRLELQNKFKCCDWGYCSSPNFAAGLNETVLSNFCVTPITSFADMTLNNVFTYVSIGCIDVL
ncbi:hypothetical protein BDQ17DRAFT_1385521, partial [Cyathus striatus]